MAVKILVVGMGGVGGYFGGHLAMYYEHDEAVEVYFLARGEHLHAIQTQGLTIVENDGTLRLARPTLATDQPELVGVVDYVMLCVKSYDLETSIAQIRPCLDENTVLIPFLNGVDAVERTKMALGLGKNEVWQGMAFIVSMIKSAGVVANESAKQFLYFGADGLPTNRMNIFFNILKNAITDVYLSDKISSIVWEKFIFISPTATLTTYYENTIGELLEDEEKTSTLLHLMEEVSQIALAKKIELPPHLKTITMEKLRAMPYATTTSLQRDFVQASRRHELEIFTGAVVRMANNLNINITYYPFIYKLLIAKKT